MGGLTADAAGELRPRRESVQGGPVFRQARLGVLRSTDRLEFAASIARERQQAGAAGIVAKSAASTYVNDDKRFQLRWEHTNGQLFNEATVTYEKTQIHRRRRATTGPQYRGLGYERCGFDSILQVDGVDPRSYFFTAQSGYSVQDDLTFSNLNWHGDHTVKTGVKFKDVKLEDRRRRDLARSIVSTSVRRASSRSFQVTFGARRTTSLPSPRLRRTASTASISRTTGR